MGRYPDAIDAAVLFACPCDVMKRRAHMYERQRWDGWLEKVDTVSPIDVMSNIATDVPVRMLVGTEDDVTPPSLSIEYEAAAKELGKNITLIQLQGAEHNAYSHPAIFAAISELAKP